MSRVRLPPVYAFFRVFFHILLRLFFRFRVVGIEKVPATGGCLLASNHASFLDPPALGGAIPFRLVHFMARRTLMKPWGLRWVMPRLEIIPVDRVGGDVSALKAALRRLREGRMVALFPEGTRSIDGSLLPPRGGIGFLIAKAGVPVVPVYIGGSFQAWPRRRRFPRLHPITVTFGSPIQPEEIAAQGTDRGSFERLAERVMQRIAELKGSDGSPANPGKTGGLE
ncbi:MAG: lysophospholipid acyltransferase family protein [Kiritimatiellia bacterium]|nr:lysophospholipid acyltransferase family protein [Kiritimatiellia bacterium]